MKISQGQGQWTVPENCWSELGLPPLIKDQYKAST